MSKTKIQKDNNFTATKSYLHPVFVELRVDSEIAGCPRVRVLLVHAQGFLGRIEVEELLEVTKVVAERRVVASCANVVGVKPCRMELWYKTKREM
jgi:hypothetical protein